MMKYRNILFLGMATVMVNFMFADQKVNEGKDYIVLDHPIESVKPDTVELIEIFSYQCPHCQKFDLLLQKYKNNLQDPKVVFRNIHVFWAPKFMTLIRLSVAVNDNRMTAMANSHIFNAILNEKINLFDERTALNWLNTQTSFDGKKIASSYQLQENKNQAKQMSLLTDRYQLESTPNLIVGEKYKVRLDAIKSEADLKRILDGLIDLSKRNKLPINTVINSGAELAKQATQ